MEKRRLGKSDLYVSKLGLGCMSLGTGAKKAEEIIRGALEMGINYFDTADLYDHGENEKIVGKVLKPVRDQVIIATKAGNRWNENGDGWFWDASKEYIKEAVKESLKRLGTDYIDLYQLHGGTMEDDIGRTIEAFEELKEEGFIRFYGISSIRPTVIREYARLSGIVSVMMQYSLMDRRPEEETMALLKEHGISLVARGPLAKGLLTENFRDKLTVFSGKGGYLNYPPDELEEALVSIRERFIGKKAMTEIAMQFVLASPLVASAVAGASTIEQLKENVAAAEKDALTTEELVWLKRMTKADRYQEHRLNA